MNFAEIIQIDKLIEMVLALGLIQFIGAVFSKKLTNQLGFILSGFVNGLISSTAFTVALSKKSQSLSENQVKVESISFLSATLAMLIQGAFLVYIGKDFSQKIAIIFLCPVVMTVFLMGVRSYKIKFIKEDFPEVPFFDIISLLKLTFFIVGIITISKLLQLKFGEEGLTVLTFLVSFFEIHGSIIANTQLFASGSIPPQQYYFLIALSLATSYIGKLIIILGLGNIYLKKRVAIWVLTISSSICMGYFLVRT